MNEGEAHGLLFDPRADVSSLDFLAPIKNQYA